MSIWVYDDNHVGIVESVTEDQDTRMKYIALRLLWRVDEKQRFVKSYVHQLLLKIREDCWDDYCIPYGPIPEAPKKEELEEGEIAI